MLEGGGKEVSIVPVVYPHETVIVSSLGYSSSIGSSSKPSRPFFPLSLSERATFKGISKIIGGGNYNS